MYNKIKQRRFIPLSRLYEKVIKDQERNVEVSFGFPDRKDNIYFKTTQDNADRLIKYNQKIDSSRNFNMIENWVIAGGWGEVSKELALRINDIIERHTNSTNYQVAINNIQEIIQRKKSYTGTFSVLDKIAENTSNQKFDIINEIINNLKGYISNSNNSPLLNRAVMKEISELAGTVKNVSYGQFEILFTLYTESIKPDKKGDIKIKGVSGRIIEVKGTRGRIGSPNIMSDVKKMLEGKSIDQKLVKLNDEYNKEINNINKLAEKGDLDSIEVNSRKDISAEKFINNYMKILSPLILLQGGNKTVAEFALKKILKASPTTEPAAEGILKKSIKKPIKNSFETLTSIEPDNITPKREITRKISMIMLLLAYQNEEKFNNLISISTSTIKNSKTKKVLHQRTYNALNLNFNESNYEDNLNNLIKMVLFTDYFDIEIATDRSGYKLLFTK